MASSSAHSARPPSPGDDATSFVLRVHVTQRSRWTALSEFEDDRRSTKDEFKLYVWRSTTLRTLCHLLHSAAPSLSQPLSLHSFRLIYYDNRKDCYAAREVAHNITRISKADLAGRLGSQEAREMLGLASKPSKENGTARETETNDAGITISQLDLEDGDLLECMILPPSPPSNEPSTGQRSARETGLTARSLAPTSRTVALPEPSHRSMTNGSNFQRDIPPHMARGFGPLDTRQAPFPPRGPAAGVSRDRVMSGGSNGRRW